MKNLALFWLISTSLCLCLSSCNQANSSDSFLPMQVAYVNDLSHFVDLDPDSVLPGPYYQGYDYDRIKLDLDDDGTNDMEFTYYTQYGNTGGITEYKINSLSPDFLTLVNESDYPVVFEEGDSVSTNATFKSGSFFLIDRGFSGQPAKRESWKRGIWHDLDHKYVVIKFQSSGDWKLGWIEIGFITNKSEMVIYKYCSFSSAATPGSNSSRF